MKPILLAAALLAATPAAAHDLTKLPLGDGRISKGPATGHIWACRVMPGAGGADGEAPWIDADGGTWDKTRKPHVQGAVSWPGRVAITTSSDGRIIISNGLPAHPTGVFPIAPDDPAFRFDRNPNAIAARTLRFAIPPNPEVAQRPTCVPGQIGVLVNGVQLFNALDAPGRDAVAHEVQDACDGHPQERGVYHYHALSDCIADKRGSDGHSALVGYIFDGFGLFGRFDVGGKELTSADLDACHGHSHEITWNGKRVIMYHYHATRDFPYTVGCIRGTMSRPAMRIAIESSGPDGERMPPTGRRPDLTRAAQALGIDVEALRRALGPPPPDLARTAAALGIGEDALVAALRSAMPD